jgi:hypothetical protein
VKYVVVEVADDLDYNALVVDDEAVPLNSPRDVKVIGVFKVPTLYCDNSDGHRGKKTEAGWTRGRKYGWWVCGACKKPTKAWAENLNALLSSARNLLNDGKDVLGAAQRSR